jgi:hypothetical protein
MVGVQKLSTLVMPIDVPLPLLLLLLKGVIVGLRATSRCPHVGDDGDACEDVDHEQSLVSALRSVKC